MTDHLGDNVKEEMDKHRTFRTQIESHDRNGHPQREERSWRAGKKRLYFRCCRAFIWIIDRLSFCITRHGQYGIKDSLLGEHIPI